MRLQLLKFKEEFIMLGIFSLLGAIFAGKELVKESFQKPVEPGSIDNSRLFSQDLNKVRFKEMTRKELDRNIRNGKYRLDNSPRARAARFDGLPVENWTLYEEDLDKIYRTKEITKEELQKNLENGKYLW